MRRILTVTAQPYLLGSVPGRLAAEIFRTQVPAATPNQRAQGEVVASSFVNDYFIVRLTVPLDGATRKPSMIRVLVADDHASCVEGSAKSSTKRRTSSSPRKHRPPRAVVDALEGRFMPSFSTWNLPAAAELLGRSQTPKAELR